MWMNSRVPAMDVRFAQREIGFIQDLVDSRDELFSRIQTTLKQTFKVYSESWPNEESYNKLQLPRSNAYPRVR